MSDEADATMEVLPSTLTQKERRQEPSCMEFKLHACYYSDLFLLRTSIHTAVNGTQIEMKLAEEGSPYIHNPEIKTGIPLSKYSQLVSRVLRNHGVYHTDTFYYEEAPLFEVVFETQDHIKIFLSKTDLVQSELEEETTHKVFCRKLLAFQDSSFICIKSELFLVTPTHCECTQKEKEPEVCQLTIDNFCEHISKWKKSKVFDFRHQFFTAVRVADENRKLKDEVVFKEVFKELRCVIKWFELGIHLDIPNFDLQAIRADYRTTSECRLEMLMLWEKLEKPTWRKLIVALTNIGEKQLAKKLATKHGIDISNSISDSTEELQRDEKSSSISPQNEQDILSKQINIANHQQDDLQKELSERKTEFISLQKKVQKLSADFIDVKTQLEYKNEEMKVIQVLKIESESSKAAKDRLLKEKEEQVRSLKSKLGKKKEELEKTKHMLETKEKELEEKTEELNAKCEETRQLKYEMSKMQQEFNSKEKEMFDKLAEMGIHSETQKKLMDQIKAQLHVAIKETSTKNAEIDTCIIKLSDKNELICKLSENIDTKEREMKSLQERLKSQTEAEESFQQEREQQLHSLAIIIVEQNLELERIKDEKMQLTLELNKAKELQRQETFVKQLKDKFIMQYELFEKWLTQGEELVSQDISSFSFQECQIYLTELQDMKESLKQKEKEFNIIENLGKILPGESEEDESKQITEKLGALEQRWHSLITQRIRESANKTVFVVLDLVKYYPQKLTLIDSITIRRVGIDKCTCTDPKQLYLLILQKIKAYDYRCRENMLRISGRSVDQLVSVSDNEISDSDDSDREITPLIHPMDGVLALIHCADDFLRQDLMARLATCQLSIPLVLPDPFTTELTFILWGLRAIVKEWKSTLQNATEICVCPLISYKAPIVSFVRFGRQTKSKSKIMNDVISDMDHNHFFHQYSEGGRLQCLLGDGLIETSNKNH